ncbi:MAG TPA: helix-turn-helix transcriptional regulator [Chloroflexota bacterium]
MCPPYHRHTPRARASEHTVIAEGRRPPFTVCVVHRTEGGWYTNGRQHKLCRGTDLGGEGGSLSGERYGRLLGRLRSGRGLSGYALARAAGLHPNLLARSEAGTRRPEGPAEIDALARALDLVAEERDELLTAAGFWPSAFLSLGRDDPTLRAIAAALTEPAVPDGARRQFRAGVEALAAALRTAATTAPGPVPGTG